MSDPQTNREQDKDVDETAADLKNDEQNVQAEPHEDTADVHVMQTTDEVEGIVQDEDSAFTDEELLGIVEALVFASEDSLSAGRICDIIVDTTGERPTPDMVDRAVDWLNALYRSGDRSFTIRSWGGGYRMATNSQYAAYIKAMYFQHRETKLSRSLLETLSIIAYKQPATKPEVDYIRGVDSDYALRRLMELAFVEISGRSEGVGKPLLYRTTELFMDKFGLSSLEDLPTLREMEELLNDPNFSTEKAHMLMKRGLDLPDTDVESDVSALAETTDGSEIVVSPPSEIISETVETSSGDGAPAASDSDLTDLSQGTDSNGQ